MPNKVLALNHSRRHFLLILWCSSGKTIFIVLMIIFLYLNKKYSSLALMVCHKAQKEWEIKSGIKKWLDFMFKLYGPALL